MDVEAICQDSSMPADARVKANGLSSLVRNRRIILLLYFMSDVIDILGIASKELQQSGATIVGKDFFILALKSRVNALHA